jgi:membrane associated rhomboid family serine protease
MTVQPAPARRRGLARLGPAGPPLLLLAIMWLLETIDVVLRGWLDNGGIQPRESEGLLGILFAPLLHGGYDHLISNTIPLLVLGTLVAASGGRGVFWKVTAVVVAIGGLGTWLIAPANTVTIGASGLVFGYLGYLLVAGIRTRHWRDLLIGAAVLLVYGTLLLGALPWTVAADVSWQAHLTGALAGGLAAWWLAARPAPRVRA